jgi:glycosyltransferase involved in cell wall biosynthesis
VGTISPVKNQYRVIEALFDIPIPLVFIGQIADMWTEYGQKCKARAAERGNTIFIDRVHHEELPGIYALAAAHVLPSWRETPGLASLEAAAAGCKIISTSIGSTQEYFSNKAWYCQPDNIMSIRQAVEVALAAPKTLDLREHILSHFTWQHTAEVTLTSYQKTLDSQ